MIDPIHSGLKSIFLGAIVIFASAFFAACSSSSVDPLPNNKASDIYDEAGKYHQAITKIEPFFERMGKPQQFDWLSSFQEKGQTFDEFLGLKPKKIEGKRQNLYILPLGNFSAAQEKIVNSAAEYLSVFYGMPLKRLPRQDYKRPFRIADHRPKTEYKAEQIRTGYIFDSILKPQLPEDAAALIAFTSEDIYPDASMLFVFGQATLTDRVGVFSLARLSRNTDNTTFLKRAVKIATHEVGHMFNFRHCTKYECVMSGTNHLGETDRRPIDACPECTAKACWLTDASFAERYKKLAEVCRRLGLKDEAADFDKKAAALKGF